MTDRTLLIVASIVCASWLVLDAHRLAQFADERVLWKNAAHLAPAKARPWNNLGNLELLAGRSDDARAAYQEAIRRARRLTDPVDRQVGETIALANLGLLAVDRNDLPMAQRCLAQAVTLNPLNPNIQDAFAWFTAQYPNTEPFAGSCS